jgi:hypothetical protein
MIEQPAGAAPTVQRDAVSIGPAVEVVSVIWIARLRTDRVAIFRASGSRAFRAAAALIAAAVAGDLADSVAIASAGVVDSVVIALGVAAVAASAASAVAGGADDNI